MSNKGNVSVTESDRVFHDFYACSGVVGLQYYLKAEAPAISSPLVASNRPVVLTRRFL